MSAWRCLLVLAQLLPLLVAGFPLPNMNSLRQARWVAPAIERACRVPASRSLPPVFEEGPHFRLVRREPGRERADLPIWTPSVPNLLPFNDQEAGPVKKTEVPSVPGAFVLSNVLTDTECDAISLLSESMGFTTDAPVSLGRDIRQNENCVIIADDSMWQPIFRRVKEHMPPLVAGGAPVGLNQRWRLYKYGKNDIFRMHTDGAWPGSALNEAGDLVQDFFGDRFSQLTFLLYLDDDYEGGETTFLVQDGGEAHLVSVAVPKGGALCFFHGEHPMSPLHEGSLVTRGRKRIVRTDVLYSLPDPACGS